MDNVVGNTEITGDANHTITFADDVDFAKTH